MVKLSNRFYRGIVHSPQQKHPNFKCVIVDTVYEASDENGKIFIDSFETTEQYYLYDTDRGDVFYVVYGSHWIDIPKSSIKITETQNLNEAIIIAEAIMGTKIVEITPR